MPIMANRGAHLLYDQQVSVHPEALPHVRHAIADALRTAGHTDAVDDVLLVVQELLTNVHRHVGDETALLCLAARDDQLHVSVRDTSPRCPTRPKPGWEPAWDAEHGRGMWLINRLCAQWETVFSSRHPGKTVHCQLRYSR